MIFGEMLEIGRAIWPGRKEEWKRARDFDIFAWARTIGTGKWTAAIHESRLARIMLKFFKFVLICTRFERCYNVVYCHIWYFSTCRNALIWFCVKCVMLWSGHQIRRVFYCCCCPFYSCVCFRFTSESIDSTEEEKKNKEPTNAQCVW